MTPATVLAAVALRSATAACPALADKPPVTLVVQPEARWPREKAHFDASKPLTVFLDSRVPRALVVRVIRHETEHLCRFNSGRADWTMGEVVR